ncbi:MAG: hypothetical protein PHD48_01355 [Alphaproteobacteria bacterium]|nr:hypothetical protein [Alphaproteobacteria bacterium]
MRKLVYCVCCAIPFLSACASDGQDKTPPRHCPQVAILRSVEKMEDYGSDAIDPSNLVAIGYMNKIEGGCDYNDKGVDVTFNLKMTANKGLRLGGDKVSFPFFVSVLKPDESVLGKELMTASFSFAEGTKVTELVQPLHVFLPLTEEEDAANFRVLVGYQLTEDQIKAKRSEN